MITYCLKKKLVIAKFRSAHGILGWIHVFSYTEQKESIFNYVPWFIEKEKKVEKIIPKKWKNSNKTFIVKIKDINDRSMANRLTNHNIIIDDEILPKLNSDEYYWKDIINCTVFTENSIKLGIIINLISTPSNDILVIKTSRKNILIPFIYSKIIKKIDILKKKIMVSWKTDF